mmetsp:Transcript_33152/g.73933  ORF Transcript_33152/g.73933 Transcript_33152/m.73933 type:complete len:292 (+) Transcript_33152:1343-2218(+)
MIIQVITSDSRSEIVESGRSVGTSAEMNAERNVTKGEKSAEMTVTIEEIAMTVGMIEGIEMTGWTNSAICIQQQVAETLVPPQISTSAPEGSMMWWTAWTRTCSSMSRRRHRSHHASWSRSDWSQTYSARTGTRLTRSAWQDAHRLQAPEDAVSNSCRRTTRAACYATSTSTSIQRLRGHPQGLRAGPPCPLQAKFSRDHSSTMPPNSIERTASSVGQWQTTLVLSMSCQQLRNHSLLRPLHSHRSRLQQAQLEGYGCPAYSPRLARDWTQVEHSRMLHGMAASQAEWQGF